MINIYEDYKSYESDKILLRPVKMEDAEDLLKVYSDKESRKFFNVDNFDNVCYFDTIDQMKNEIKFYMDSYKNGWFVRWVIVKKDENKIIGMIENFDRIVIDDNGQKHDSFSDDQVFRLDLKSEYEKSEIIKQIINLMIKDTFNDFRCAEIATKAVPEAKERISALLSCGFSKSSGILIGNKGQKYKDYYVYKR